MKPDKKDRPRMILECLWQGDFSCNAIAHSIWADWIGPRGKGSHPLIRITGKLLNRLERDGMVRKHWSKFDKKMIWSISVKGRDSIRRELK